MSAGVVEFTPWQLFVMGGPLLVPIAICAVFALTIVIQKFDHFRSCDEGIRLLKDRLLGQVRQNNIKQAILSCDASGSWGAPVLKAGLMRFGGSRQEIMEAMEDAARFEVPKLEKGLVILSTIASITPLLGLLGTVLGLCGAFHIIQVRAAAMNPVAPGDIAGGIWQALITTVVSLVVAIPVFIIYNYFVNKIHLLVRDIEKVSLRLADLMTRVSAVDGPEKE
jgi:biopolymer transport protein ExbB